MSGQKGRPDQRSDGRGKPSRKPRDAKGGRGGGRTPEEAEAQKLRSTLVAILGRLPQIERNVLEARMGLIDGTPMKPGETAERLGLTINEVKKIELRAFERIREIGSLQGLEKFLPKAD